MERIAMEAERFDIEQSKPTDREYSQIYYKIRFVLSPPTFLYTKPPLNVSFLPPFLHSPSPSLLIRSALNLVGKLGPWLEEPLSGKVLTVQLVEFLSEVVASQLDFAQVRAIRIPGLTRPALFRVNTHLGNTDLRFFKALGTVCGEGTRRCREQAAGIFLHLL